MPVHPVSLALYEPQTIPADGAYHIVRFPYDAASESYDAHDMHPVVHPDGYTVTGWAADDRSGLIWPAVDGWGVLTADIHWEAGAYTELRERFVRNPLNPTAYNSTATDHRPPSPGMQCFTKHHQMFVHVGTPIALLAAHNDSTPRKIVHAQFKLAISTLA